MARPGTVAAIGDPRSTLTSEAPGPRSPRAPPPIAPKRRAQAPGHSRGHAPGPTRRTNSLMLSVSFASTAFFLGLWPPRSPAWARPLGETWPQLGGRGPWRIAAAVSARCAGVLNAVAPSLSVADDPMSPPPLIPRDPLASAWSRSTPRPLALSVRSPQGSRPPLPPDPPGRSDRVVPAIDRGRASRYGHRGPLPRRLAPNPLAVRTSRPRPGGSHFRGRLSAVSFQPEVGSSPRRGGVV